MKILQFILYLITFYCLFIIDIMKSAFTPPIVSIHVFYLVVYCFFLALFCMLLGGLRIDVTDHFKVLEGCFLGLDIFRLEYSRIISEWIGVLLHKVWFFCLGGILWLLGVVVNDFGLVLKVFKAWGRLGDSNLVNNSFVSWRANWGLVLEVYLALVLLRDFLIDLLIIGLIVLKDE